jgi:DNA-3-methyladenine glycosylase I
MNGTDGLILGADGRRRCWWHGDDPLYRAYHDDEWGRPVADDRRLFEKLSLEGFQAGLSWLTILRKRENFRRAFRGFEIEPWPVSARPMSSFCSRMPGSSATGARSRR